MPLLFSLGQHGALQATQGQLQPQERLMACLDDVHMVSQPERVGGAYAVLEEELVTHAGIKVHGERARCGTWLEFDPLLVMCWSALLAMKIRGQWCGEVLAGLS